MLALEGVPGSPEAQDHEAARDVPEVDAFALYFPRGSVGPFLAVNPGNFECIYSVNPSIG